MASPFPRFSLVLAMFAGALVLTDCHCGKSTTLQKVSKCANGSNTCTKDADCNDHEACAAAGGESCCTFSARTCKQSSDCCPGQICKRDGHCFDQRIECPNGDSDCGDPGSDRVCLTYTDGQGKSDQVCGYAPCDATHACSDGLSCFKGFCVGSPPCNGHCDDGSICIPQNNTCWGYGTRCTVSCGPGYLAVEKDPNNVWDSCNNRDVECECAELPALVSNDLGRYSSSTATTDGKIAVSMYDGQYGDLVVRTYDNTGALVKTEYVDGVPSSGSIVAGPSGPRGGIADPGPDVGQYTSITSDSSGKLFVSYYDVTNKDLKLAIRDSSGAWTTQTVDSAGDVGMYSSVTLDGSGRPTIAYFQRAGAIGATACSAAAGSPNDLITGVKLAVAHSASPASTSDWSTSFVECAARPPPPCYGCTSGQICVSGANNTTTCEASASGCSGCQSSQVCVNQGGAPTCATAYTDKPLADVPMGVGLYPSVAYKDANVVVAYYDRINRVLRAATGTAGALSPVTIDDGDDVGLFSTLAVEPSGSKRIAIAYHDASRRSLKFYMATSLAHTSNAADSVIDTGLAPPQQDGPSFVGGNVHLLFAKDGNVWAAYQNSTANDLRLAVRASNGWQVKQNWSQGAVGYFADLAQLPSANTLYVSHAQLHTKLQQGHPVKDNTPHLEVYQPQ